MKFVIPYEPRIQAPAFIPIHHFVKEEPVPEPVPQPQEDPLHQLQLEKAILQSEIELLNIMKKKLEVRVLLFKKKASDYWEVGSAEMEFS